MRYVAPLGGTRRPPHAQCCRPSPKLSQDGASWKPGAVQFFVDAAPALAATGEEDPTGLHFETLIANELLIWRDHAPRRALHHWRIASGPEVDFVLRDGSRAVAVELKGAKRVDRADARHLATFLDRYPETSLGVVLSADPDVRPLGERLLAVPWWAFV